MGVTALTGIGYNNNIPIIISKSNIYIYNIPASKAIFQLLITPFVSIYLFII